VLFCPGWLQLRLVGVVPSDQTIQIVAVRPVGAECALIEQTFDTAIKADLVGAVLRTNGPAHFAVPATSQDHHSGTC